MPTTAERIGVEGPAGNLEAVIETPRAHGAAVAVLCHPHPLHQGTMNNKVVTTLSRAFVRCGVVAIRFNFRGVGESSGVHDGGRGEVEDAAAVVAFASRRWPDSDLYLGGFSFGAAVALRIARTAHARGLITIAPPVLSLPAVTDHPRCPWLLIQGTDDDIVAARDVENWAARMEPPPEVRMVSGAGHFFHGRLVELGNAAAEFLARKLSQRGRAP